MLEIIRQNHRNTQTINPMSAKEGSTCPYLDHSTHALGTQDIDRTRHHLSKRTQHIRLGGIISVSSHQADVGPQTPEYKHRNSISLKRRWVFNNGCSERQNSARSVSHLSTFVYMIACALRTSTCVVSSLCALQMCEHWYQSLYVQINTQIQ